MIKMVTYNGKVLNLSDIEVTWVDSFGDMKKGNIEDYGRSEWHEAWAECEAGEGW